MTDSDSSGQSGWNNPAQGASGGGYGYQQGGNPYGGQPAGNPYGYPQQPQQQPQGGYGYPQATPGYGAQPDASAGANPYGNQYADPYGAAQQAAPAPAWAGGYGGAASGQDAGTVQNLTMLAQVGGGVAAGLSVLRTLLRLIAGMSGSNLPMTFLFKGIILWAGAILAGAAAWAALKVVRASGVWNRTTLIVAALALVGLVLSLSDGAFGLANWFALQHLPAGYRKYVG